MNKVLQDRSVSVILVEDDTVLQTSLSEYLTLKGFRVVAVGTALEFFQQMDQQNFMVAVIDVGLPDQSGHVLVDHARQQTDMSLIVITANDSLNTRVNSYQSGADLFMSKPLDGRELAAAIESLALRHIDRKPQSAAGKDSGWMLDMRNWSLSTPDNGRIELTAKEFAFLECLIKTPSETVKRTEILNVLYQRDDQSAQAALDTLVRRVRQKISAKYRGNSPIRTAYSVGYIFAAPVTLIAESAA